MSPVHCPDFPPCQMGIAVTAPRKAPPSIRGLLQAPRKRAERQSRRRRPKRSWPICLETGKKRFGEHKDAKLALRAALHVRAQATLDGHDSSWTVRRAYQCEFCDGWHLTSIKSWGDYLPMPDWEHDKHSQIKAQESRSRDLAAQPGGG